MNLSKPLSIRRPRSIALTSLAVGVVTPSAGLLSAYADDFEHIEATKTPIKHLIILIGENRTFDNIYGTYVPRHGQSVSNLLSKGIVKADGSPGPTHSAAKQFTINTIDPVAYFINTNKLINPQKTAYSPFLPTPEAGNAPPQAVTLQQLQKAPAPAAPPFDANTFSPQQLHTLSPVLEGEDLALPPRVLPV